jgi:hypothetical protein
LAAHVFGSSPNFFFTRKRCRVYVPFSISRQIRAQYCWNVL